MLVIQGLFQAALSFLPHFDDLPKSVFSLMPISFSFIDFAEVAKCLEVLLDVLDAIVDVSVLLRLT